MKGYEIIERRHLTLYREDGITPYEIKMGLLDFLRELNAGPEGITRHSSFMVVGIDDVLYLTKREDRSAVALDIHKVLHNLQQMNLKRKRLRFRSHAKANWSLGQLCG